MMLIPTTIRVEERQKLLGSERHLEYGYYGWESVEAQGTEN